jgi:hypothetical protein
MDVYLLSLPLARHRTIVPQARDLAESVDNATPEPACQPPEATAQVALRHAFTPLQRHAR